MRTTTVTLATSLLVATLAACAPPGGGGPDPDACDAGEPFNDGYSTAVEVDLGTFLSCNDQTDGGNDQDVFVLQLDDESLSITCTSEGTEADFAVEYSATPASLPTDVLPTGTDEEPCDGVEEIVANQGAGYYYLTVEHPNGSEQATLEVSPAG